MVKILMLKYIKIAFNELPPFTLHLPPTAYQAVIDDYRININAVNTKARNIIEYAK